MHFGSKAKQRGVWRQLGSRKCERLGMGEEMKALVNYRAGGGGGREVNRSMTVLREKLHI